MSLVFSAAVPHTPMLIPNIGKNQAEQLTATRTALDEIMGAIKTARVETVIVVSGHGDRSQEGLTVHIKPSFDLTFESFGDFDTKTSVLGDVSLASRIKEPFDVHRSSFPLITTSNLPLDYGLTVPLYVLCQSHVDSKVVPLQLRYKKPGPEYMIGAALRPILLDDSKRVALIVSANLSHRLSASSPAGLSPRAATFDKKIIDLVKKRDQAAIKRIHASTLEAVQPCGIGSLLFWLGVLEGTNGQVELLAYEYPFGIGLPTFIFRQ